MKFALYSPKTVLPDGVRAATILVEAGTIVDIVAKENIPADFELHDMGEYVILPGLIDVHVHVNEPGRTEWEGFETATKAAAAGGITTIVDMPLNSMPVTVTPEAFEQKLQAAENQLWVDMAFHAGVIPHHLQHLESLLQAGCVAGKTFMIDSGLGDFPATGEDDLRQAMRLLAKHGRPLFAHAELDLGPKIAGAQWPSYQEYLLSRPPSWEVAAIELLLKLCRETGCHVHIVHLSAAAALPLLRSAKAEGLPLTVETAPHYLYFSAEQIPDGATQFKCAPPIRNAENQRLLWEALLDGTINLIATDHSPCSPDLKLFDQGDFKGAWGGISSLQFLLSATWSAAKKQLSDKRLTDDDILSLMVRWLSKAPADLLNLSNKGHIAVGYTADLTVFDPKTEFQVVAEQIYHKHKHTPYLNETLQGAIVETYLNGQRVYNKLLLFENKNGKTILQPIRSV